MSDNQTAHCRLCANVKPHSKLTNLQIDEEKSQLMLEKLSRLNVELTNLNSGDDPLPKTVCITCTESLDKAFNFVIDVESAQSKLNELISLEQNIKEEYECHSAENFEYTYELVAVKSEDEDSELETDQNKNELNDNKLEIHNKKSIKPSNPIQSAETWKDYSWMCACCETLFPNVEELISHSMKYHSGCNIYRCTDCHRRKFNLDKFVKHVRRHRQHLKLSCYKCYEVFPRAYDTKVHQTTHVNTELKCSGCNNSFPSVTELTAHCNAYKKDWKLQEKPAEEKTNKLTCTFCEKSFKYKGTLTTHLLTHAERKRNHICDKCGKCFANKTNLAGHLMMHEDLRPHKCEICKRGFRTAYKLREHIGIHEGKKPFSCEKCGRSFRLACQLRSHSIIHTDSLPHVCNVCDKGFRFRTILVQHLRQHTGVRPYACQICQRDFTNWPNFRKHMKNSHNKEVAKKKYTPNGLFPINPTTGEVVMKPQTDENLEWIKKIRDAPKYIRKKYNTQSSNIKIKSPTTTNVET